MRNQRANASGESPARTLALLGAPCSGKTTQGEILVEKFGALMFDTGAELREHADEETKAWINAGNLADIGIIEKLLRGFFQRLGEGQMAVLVGFPRSIEQAQRMELVLDELGVEPARLVVLNVDMETARTRAFTRKRIDDTKEIVDKREQVYLQQTEPVIGFGERQGWKVLHIDGEAAITEVQAEIEAAAGLQTGRLARAI